MVILFIAVLSIFFKVNTGQEIAGFKKNDLEKVLHVTGVTYDGSTEDLVKVTQKSWLRPNNKERWELGELFESKREELVPLFRKMGLVDERKNILQFYEYIFFMGAHLDGMKNRMKVLEYVLAQGLSYKNIVFLSGARDLTEQEKDEAARLGWSPVPTTEAEVAPFLCSDQGIVMDKVVLIDAPKVQQSDGTWRRPTTADTVEKWLQTKPAAGSIVIISSQPFCHNQKVVVESLVPEDFVVDVVGAKASEDTKIAVYLDTIARTLYQWNNAKTKH